MPVKVAVRTIDDDEIFALFCQAVRLIIICEREGCLHICPLEKFGMIADFTELHDKIHKTLDAVVVTKRRCFGDEISHRYILP